MKGRTNLAGGGGLAINGDVISAEATGENIVAGDFVEKLITTNSLISTKSASSALKGSDIFPLSDGTFCTFFTTSYYLSAGGLKMWKFKIQGDELLDMGEYTVSPIEIDDYDSVNVLQTSENEFLLIVDEPYSSSEKKIDFVVININGDIITSKSVGQYTSTANEWIIGTCRLSNEKIVILTRKYINSQYSTTYYINLFVVNLLEDVIEVGESVSLGNNNYYAYLEESVAYGENQFIVSWYYHPKSNSSSITRSVELFGVSGVKLEKIREESIDKYISSLYIGDSKTLFVKRDGSSIIAQTLTLSESVLNLSSEFEIASVPFTTTSDFTIYFFETGNQIFVVVGNGSGKYAIGKFNISTLNAGDLIEIFNSATDYSFRGLILSDADLLFLVASSESYLEINRLKFTGATFESYDNTIKVRKNVSRIDGVAKTSGNIGDIIDVYVPSET